MNVKSCPVPTSCPIWHRSSRSSTPHSRSSHETAPPARRAAWRTTWFGVRTSTRIGGYAGKRVGATAGRAAATRFIPLPVVRRCPPGQMVKLRGRGKVFVVDVPGPTPDAPTVVLLHGLGAAAQLCWSASCTSSRTHRVIALDQRWHGRGIQSPRFRIDDCADDVSALLKNFGVGPAIIAGYSMGGPVAQEVWRRHPDRVAGLVLASTATTWRGHLGEKMFFPVMGMRHGRAGRAASRPGWPGTPSASPSCPTPTQGDTIGWGVREFRNTSLLSIAEVMGELGRFDSTGWISQGRRPHDRRRERSGTRRSRPPVSARLPRPSPVPRCSSPRAGTPRSSWTTHAGRRSSSTPCARPPRRLCRLPSRASARGHDGRSLRSRASRSPSRPPSRSRGALCWRSQGSGCARTLRFSFKAGPRAAVPRHPRLKSESLRLIWSCRSSGERASMTGQHVETEAADLGRLGERDDGVDDPVVVDVHHRERLVPVDTGDQPVLGRDVGRVAACRGHRDRDAGEGRVRRVVVVPAHDLPDVGALDHGGQPVHGRAAR